MVRRRGFRLVKHETDMDFLKNYDIILASNSPRRKELLAGLDIPYRVCVLPDIDESYPDTLRGRRDSALHLPTESGGSRRPAGRTYPAHHSRYHCMARRAGLWQTARQGRSPGHAARPVWTNPHGHHRSNPPLPPKEPLFRHLNRKCRLPRSPTKKSIIM